MKNILVLAYAISPTRGSEYLVAWNYVREMSRDHCLTVLFGTSGDHMGQCEEMMAYAKHHALPHVTFIPVYPRRLASLLNWCNRHHFFTYSFYWAYRIWHEDVYIKAKQLVAHQQFDLVHYVGMIGYREPGFLWKLGLPYVWGPIGGANNPPMVMIQQMNLWAQLKYAFRTVANIIQLRYSSRLKKALAETDVLLTSTTETQRIFRSVHGKDSVYIPENAIAPDERQTLQRAESRDGLIHLSVAGSLDARKSINIFLDAVARVKSKRRLHINIAGDGPHKKALMKQARRLGIAELITWHGQVTRAEVVRIFQRTHLHVLTSVSEANTTVILEAMSCGVPTLSFDHCGMHDTLRDGAGILVPIYKTYEECLAGVADAIDKVLEDDGYLERLSQATIERAGEYTWEKRREVLNNLYEQLLRNKTPEHDLPPSIS